MLRVFASLGYISVVAFASQLTHALAQGDKAPSGEPSLEQLLEWNAREIFGCEVAPKDGRVTLKYLGKGQFNRGFRSGSSGGKGFISNLDEIKDIVLKPAVSEGLGDAFSFAAIDSGEALSKFEMADDFKISFRVRTAMVPPAGSLLVRVNQQSAKEFIQTNFFQDLTVADGGRPKRKATTNASFLGPPSKWFLQKAAGKPTPVDIVFKERKITVSVTTFENKDAPGKPAEVVSQDAIDKPSSGKIFFKFSKLNFGVADLVIEGKYSQAWAEGEIARLRKEGKLRAKPPEPEQIAKKDEKGKAKGQSGDKKGAEPEKKAHGGKRPPPNVDQPDSGAQDDL